jgi:hypothetical protein
MRMQYLRRIYLWGSLMLLPGLTPPLYGEIATAEAAPQNLNPPASTMNAVGVGAASAVDDFSLSHRFGFGLSTYPQYRNGIGPLLSCRYWFNEKFALELAAGYDQTGSPSGLYDASNNELINRSLSAQESLALKYNIGRPVKYVRIQGIIQVGGVQSNSYQYQTVWVQNVSTGYSYTDNVGSWQNPNIYFSGYVGVGFEAYIPFWTNISVEGSVGLNVGTTESNSQYGKSIWIWSLETTDSGAIPLNAAIHYYY